MRKALGFLILMCVACIVSLYGQTAGERPVVRIYAGDQPPLITENGGIVKLVTVEALKRGGYTPVVEFLPIGRMLKLLERDSLDVYITPTNTAAQHNPHVLFLAAKGVFFFLKANAPSSPVTKLEDLAGKKVGTVTNSPLRVMFEKAGIIVDEGPFETMFQKLAAGRVDFVSTADVGGLLTINGQFPGREREFDFTEFSYTTIGAGLYAKPGPEGEAILEAARKGFSLMKSDGTLSRMLLEAFGKEYSSRVFVY